MDWRTIARIARREIAERFLEPQTKQLVTYSEQWKKGLIPTPREAYLGIPNGPSYSTGVEDATLRGNAFLASLCDEYDLTYDGEVKTLAHTLFEGIRRTQDAAEPPGFVPRFVLPDGRSCYPNSSGDQHTILFYGLWRYVKSPIATAEQKRAAADITGRVMDRMRKHGWRIVSKDGTNAHAGGQLRGTRLLAVLLAAFKITGDNQWLEIFQHEVHEDLHAMVQQILGDGPGMPPGGGFYGPQQHAELLTILAEDDLNWDRRAFFRNARKEIAERFLRDPIPTESHCPTYSDECKEALGEAAHIPSPLDAPKHFRPELWGMEEDRDWRKDYQRWVDMDGEPGPSPYIKWWLGLRPGICHERNCSISPLVAYHVCLLSGDEELAKTVAEPLERHFDTTDITQAQKLGSLTGAHAVAVLAMGREA